MSSEKQKKEREHLWRAWALWAFWTSEECVQFLRLLNPEASWRELCLSFRLFVSLPEELSLDLYSRLHGKGGTEACRRPNILDDLSSALAEQMALDDEWRGRLRLSA